MYHQVHVQHLLLESHPAWPLSLGTALIITSLEPHQVNAMIQL